MSDTNNAQSNVDQVKQNLEQFVQLYQKLTEKEKFQLGGLFNQLTGGKLSPFNAPDVVCVGLVPVKNDQGELGFLGVRRAIPPCVGEIALPGGFLEQNEDPASGAVREILEETGISILKSSLSCKDLPQMGHGNHTLVFFESDTVLSMSDILEANERLDGADQEASELVFIDTKTPLCFPLHQQAVNNAFLSQDIQPEIAQPKSLKFTG